MEHLHQIGDLLLYKNNQLIAFNKPSGIPVQPDKTEAKSLLSLAEIYSKSNIHLIHRLDRPASGVVLFAKNKKALAKINLQFEQRSILKKYLAVVKSKPGKESATLTHFLKKNGKIFRTHAFDKETKGAKEAILKYKTIGASEQYFLLEIELLTGRFHQVRAQLGAIGCPIKGDVKYGARRANKNKSIHLHAWKLGFQHPVSKEQTEIVASPPAGPIWESFVKEGII